MIDLQSVGQMHLQKIWSGLGLLEPDLPRSLKASGESSCVHYSSVKDACTEGLASPSVEFLTGVEISVPTWAQSQCMQQSSLTSDVLCLCCSTLLSAGIIVCLHAHHLMHHTVERTLKALQKCCVRYNIGSTSCLA